MSEGNVYVCRWERSEEQFRIWLRKRPSISAEGDTLVEALEELSGAVCLATGDGGAVFELDPPASGNTAQDRLVALSGNSGWYPPKGFSLDDVDDLYEGGVCRTCCTGLGRRSRVPLPVGALGKGDLLIGGLRMPRALLASEGFRSRLTPAEQACIDWVALDLQGTSRRRFFEVRSTRPVKAVADRSKPAYGWRCPDCKSACFSVDYDHEYVAKADMAKSSAGLVMMDNFHQVEPVIPFARWVQIRGGRGTRNVVSTEVVQLPAARVRRRPELRTLTKSGSRAIRREFEYTAGNTP
jgi:hypothetical protein